MKLNIRKIILFIGITFGFTLVFHIVIAFTKKDNPNTRMFHRAIPVVFHRNAYTRPFIISLELDNRTIFYNDDDRTNHLHTFRFRRRS